MNKSIPDFLSERVIAFIAVTLGLLLSAWLISINGLVNSDGAAYLLAASGDWSAAALFSNWKFYPLLLQQLSELSGYPPEPIAYGLNALFDAITLYFFLRIIQLFGGGRLTLIWAAVAFLALTYFNDNRAELVRGHGYWAAFMVGLWFYIRLYRVFSWGRVVGWTIAMCFATLFRVEGIAFLTMAPLGLLGNTSISFRERFISLVKTWLPLLIMAIGVVVFFSMLGGFQERLLEVVNIAENLYVEVTQVIPRRAEVLQNSVFPFLGDREAQQSIYVILGWGILTDFVESLTLLFFLIFLFRQWFPAKGITSDASSIIWVFAIINLLVLVVWTVIHQTMVSRYTLVLAFLALIWVVFGLAEVHRRFNQSAPGERVRQEFYVLILLVFTLLADGVIESGSGKLYIADAGQWIQKNLPADRKIGTNYEPVRLRYYANKGLSSASVYEIQRAKLKQLKQFDYLMLRLRKGKLEGIKNPAFLEQNLRRINEITDDSGNGYAVYSR